MRRRINRTTDDTAPPEDYAALREECQTATPEQWNSGLERRVRRHLVASCVKPRDVERVLGVYRRAPYLMVPPPPPGVCTDDPEG